MANQRDVRETARRLRSAEELSDRLCKLATVSRLQADVYDILVECLDTEPLSSELYDKAWRIEKNFMLIRDGCGENDSHRAKEKEEE